MSEDSRSDTEHRWLVYNLKRNKIDVNISKNGNLYLIIGIPHKTKYYFPKLTLRKHRCLYTKRKHEMYI